MNQDYINRLKSKSGFSAKTGRRAFSWIGSVMSPLLLFIFMVALNPVHAQNIITGTVTDGDTGESLPGVTIQIKGTTDGVITDFDGVYRISAKPEDVLMFSFIGFATKEVQVLNQTELSVSMSMDVQELSEVVVTALGIEREEKSLGYAVASVDAKQLTEAGATSVGSSLYGKLAGVRVTGGNGGAASAINIQVRGTSSINGNTQPLYVIDGVPMRNSPLINSAAGASNVDPNQESRVRENGLLDINPEDIESLTVLKGASASALYGSNGNNGVVVITTKKGTKNQGLGVSVKLQYDVESLMMQPDFQNTYGPGYGPTYDQQISGSYDGWVTEDDGSVHPNYGAYGQFGPKFDGRTVTYWDGSQRAYKAQKDNYKDFFNTGSNFNGSVAISNSTEKATYRVSYTRTDYEGIMPGFNMEKNNFNLNASLNLSDKLKLDFKSTYFNSHTHNRPQMLYSVFGNYNGMFSRFDDIDIIKDKYKTSEGYKYVVFNRDGYNDEERFKYSNRATGLLDYYWTQLENSQDEYTNRIMNSATLSYKISDKFNLRGRIGNDYTNTRWEIKQHNEFQSSLGTGNSSYQVNRGEYSLIYGDFMANYSEQFGTDWNLNLTAGFTYRKDNYLETRASTNGGLVIENWFNLANSANNFTTDQIKSEQRKEMMVAGFGILDLSYKSFLYLQGSGRYEGRSSLPAANNHYFYPSINGSFVFSEAFAMPEFLDYGKFRSSFGVVANAPSVYAASVNYGINSVTTSNGSVLYQTPASSNYGNDGIKPEKKHAWEFGLETSWFESKLGFDFTYYTSVTKNQISTVSTATSIGTSSILSNAGSIGNQGFEVMVRFTPLRTPDFRWDMSATWAFNKNKVISLMEGQTYINPLTNVYSYDSFDNGAMLLRAEKGEALGNVYVHPIATDENGNKIVTADGLYEIDSDSYVKAGNIMPKGVGGLTNTLTYKSFSLNIQLDYRFGSKMISLPYYYMKGAGMFESTLKHRDEANGGLSYDIDPNGNFVQSAGGVYHDGIVLEGVTEGGEQNTKVVDAGFYYNNVYGWGSGSGYYGDYSNALMKNSYVKLREVTITYTVPKAVVSKVGLKSMQVSLLGRDLFYVWKNTPDNWNPESAVGSNWISQGVDNYAAAPTRSIGMMLRANF